MGRIGVAQFCASEDKDQNLLIVKRLVEDAVAQGVDFLSLPECFAFVGASPGASRAAAEPLHEGLFSHYRSLARENKIWLSLGGFHESGADDDDRIFNTHVVIDGLGDVRATYRKTHMFDVDTPDGKFLESASTAPGDTLVVCRNTPVGDVGLSICYDVRFPEVYSSLRKAGADVLLVPSAFMPSTGQAHWEVLLRARAIETQCYVAASAQIGKHSEFRSSYGHSLLVDPWGQVLADAKEQRECVITAEVSRSTIDGVRGRMPVLGHRREDLYSCEVVRQ